MENLSIVSRITAKTFRKIKVTINISKIRLATSPAAATSKISCILFFIIPFPLVAYIIMENLMSIMKWHDNENIPSSHPSATMRR